MTSAKVAWGAAIALVLIGGMGLDKAEAAQCGQASWYGTESGSKTASGERLGAGGMTAAHRTLPFGTQVRVENLNNGRSAVVRINDRGPFVRGRVIDVNKLAAQQLGMIGSGTARVRVTVVGTGAALSEGSC